MKKAAVYIELIAECPKCSEPQAVEWVDESESELSEWTCTDCLTEFTYCHPSNNYGL